MELSNEESYDEMKIMNFHNEIFKWKNEETFK
jgi:hypothetical protein